jgi:VCBS repeat-containing protein
VLSAAFTVVSVPTVNAADSTAVSVASAGAFIDPDGDPLTYSASGLPAGLSINAATGLISGTLAANASSAAPAGLYAIVVTADDGRGGSAQQSFTLNASNPPPQAANDSASLNEDSSVSGNVLANDSDPDGDALSIDTTPVIAPLHGTVVLGSNGSYLYTPDANYAGTDSFTYRVRDADGGVATATVTFTVAAVNDAPIANNDTVNVLDGRSVTGNVLANDSDVEGDPLRVDTTPVTPPAHGSLVLNADGSFRYTPNANYSGPDEFSYRTTDAHGATAVARVLFNVAAANDVPVSVVPAPVQSIALNPSAPLDQRAGPPSVREFESLLLRELNGLKRLDSTADLSFERPLLVAVDGAKSFDSTAELNPRASVVSQAIGSTNVNVQVPVVLEERIEEPSEDTAPQAADDAVPIPQPDSALTETPNLTSSPSAPGEPAVPIDRPITLSQQLRVAGLRRVTEIEALSQALN